MKIDGITVLKEFGIGVNQTSGILDLLKKKQAFKHSWSDRNGDDYFVESQDILYEPRRIKLDCWVVASSGAEFENRIQRFVNLIDRPYLRTLEFSNIDRPFMVYNSGGSSIRILTNGLRTGKNVGSFSIEFIEPDPVYPFLSVGNVSAGQSISLSLKMFSGKAVIYWGDGTITEATATALTAYSHTYTQAGSYKISILEDYDQVDQLAANNAKFSGPVDSILKSMANATSINLSSSSMNYFNSGVIPKFLTTLNFNACKFASSDDVNRVLKSLVDDGTYKIGDRKPALTVNLTGTGMPVCTDWSSYDTADAVITIIVNGVHP